MSGKDDVQDPFDFDSSDAAVAGGLNRAAKAAKARHVTWGAPSNCVVFSKTLGEPAPSGPLALSLDEARGHVQQLVAALGAVPPHHQEALGNALKLAALCAEPALRRRLRAEGQVDCVLSSLAGLARLEGECGPLCAASLALVLTSDPNTSSESAAAAAPACAALLLLPRGSDGADSDGAGPPLSDGGKLADAEEARRLLRSASGGGAASPHRAAAVVSLRGCSPALSRDRRAAFAAAFGAARGWDAAAGAVGAAAARVAASGGAGCGGVPCAHSVASLHPLLALLEAASFDAPAVADALLAWVGRGGARGAGDPPPASLLAALALALPHLATAFDAADGAAPAARAGACGCGRCGACGAPPPRAAAPPARAAAFASAVAVLTNLGNERAAAGEALLGCGGVGALAAALPRLAECVRLAAAGDAAPRPPPPGCDATGALTGVLCCLANVAETTPHAAAHLRSHPHLRLVCAVFGRARDAAAPAGGDVSCEAAASAVLVAAYASLLLGVALRDAAPHERADADAAVGEGGLASVAVTLQRFLAFHADLNTVSAGGARTIRGAIDALRGGPA